MRPARPHLPTAGPLPPASQGDALVPDERAQPGSLPAPAAPPRQALLADPLPPSLPGRAGGPGGRGPRPGLPPDRRDRPQRRPALGRSARLHARGALPRPQLSPPPRLRADQRDRLGPPPLQPRRRP